MTNKPMRVLIGNDQVAAIGDQVWYHLVQLDKRDLAVFTGLLIRIEGEQLHVQELDGNHFQRLAPGQVFVDKGQAYRGLYQWLMSMVDVMRENASDYESIANEMLDRAIDWEKQHA